MINRRSDFYSFCKTIWGCFSDENVAVLSNLSFCSVLTDIEEEGDFYFWPPSEGPGHQSSRKTEKSLSLQIITPGAIQVRTNPTGSYACSMHIIINIVNSPVRFHPPKIERKQRGKITVPWSVENVLRIQEYKLHQGQICSYQKHLHN